MTTISSAGIGSGLNVDSIVSQLMAIEKQPLTVLQTKASKIQSSVSEYGKIKSGLSTLNDLASKLASSTTWAQTVASSDGGAVSATTSGSAPGTYSVAVQSLASVQTLATASRDASTPIGAGTLNIQLGTWGANQASFTPKGGAGDPGIDITLDASDTLATARDKINAAGAGVTALLMTDGSGSRLLLRSNTTGATSAFRTSGVAALAYDPSTGSSAMTQSQTAADAKATVNGLAVSSSTNTFAGIVDGLTLNVSAVTTTPATVTVASDTASLKKTLTDFAAAYSAVVQLIGTDTKYDATTKTAGILQGDSSAVGLRQQLQTLAGSVSGASSMFGRLSDVGLQIQADGSMKLDDGKANNALANLAETKKLFTASSLTDPTQDGFGKRFRVATSAMLGSDGSLTTRTTGLASQLKRNQADQDTLSDRLDATEARLRAQYTALDTKMAALTSQSSYITQQIAAWNANK